MSRIIRSWVALAFALILLPSISSAQSISDGVRLATELLPSGSRSQAMGGNLISAADGYSALDANPAALAPIPSKDFGISLYNRSYNSNAFFLGSSESASLSNLALSSAGFAVPFKTTQGHMAVAISFDQVRDYHTTYEFKGANPGSSSLFNTQQFIADPHQGPGWTGNRQYFADNNLAYALNLTDQIPDTGAVTLTTPYKSGLVQSGTVTEEGSLNAVRVGGAVDIAEGVSAGATLNLLFGSYDKRRDYSETDVAGTYASTGFQSANIIDAIHEDQTGGSLKLGLLVNKFDVVRFGVTVETPEVLHVSHSFYRTGTSMFTTGIYSSDNMGYNPILLADYDYISPLRIGAGASVHLLGLTASASASYADMTQLRFNNGSSELDVLNQDAQDMLRPILSLHFGGEYVIPIIGLSVRAGFGLEPSPYKGDPSSFDTKTISGGLGLLLSKSVLLEAGIQHTTYHTLHTIYDDLTVENTPVNATVNDDAVTRNDMTVTLNYRF